MKKIMVNKQLLPMKAHYFLWNAGTGPVVPFLSSYARQLGFSSVVVGFVYTILPVSGMLAKPLFGSIADRFHCQKMLFLIAQLLTAVAFLSIFYSPKIEIDRLVHFSCQNNTAIFDSNSTGTMNDCSISQFHGDNTMDKCEMTCDMNSDIADILCKEWNIQQYCQTNPPDTFPFTANVPKSEIELLDAQVKFRVPNITLHDGTPLQPKCPGNRSISTYCQVQCNDYDMNDLIGLPAIKDSDVYGLYHFWTFLLLMVIAWIGQAIAVSIGDAICFELLGDSPHKYGYQRLFGALGWGLISALTGLLIDALSTGKSQKDYTCAFYLSASFLVLDFLASTRIQYTQKKLTTNIFHDIGCLLLNIRIDIYLIWCICVGMCTGCIWQFLFWLVEDLAGNQGCETLNYVKSLQGIMQAVQCLAGEVPFFFLSGRIIKKLGHTNTMSLVLFVLGIRFVLYSVVSNPWYFLPIELTNGLTFGLFFACMASYASIIAPSGTEATMQGLVGAVFEGIGVSAGSFIGGAAYNKYGGPLTFRYFGFGAFIACFVHVAVQYILALRDIPVVDNLILDSLYKYAAIARDSKQYIAVKQDDCSEIFENEIRICYNHFPKALSHESPCEIIILMESKLMPNCDKVVIGVEDYNVQKLVDDKWLLTVSNQLPVTTTCPGRNSETEIIQENSLLTLESKCSAFIGTTRVYASSDNNKTLKLQLFIPEITYDCCNHLPKREDLPVIKPVKINHLNLDDLNIAQEKLREYDKNLNKIINEPFTTRHSSTFTYICMTFIFILILWIIFKCCLKRRYFGYFNTSPNSDDGHQPRGCCSQIFNYCNVRSTISRRPSIHLTPVYDNGSEEIVFQTPSTPMAASTSRRNPKKI